MNSGSPSRKAQPLRILFVVHNSSTIASLVSYLGRRGQVVWTVNTINDAKLRIEQQKLEVAFISLGLKGINHKEAAEKLTADCNIPCVHFNENTGMRAELALKKIEVPFKSLAPNTGPKLLAVAQAAIKNMSVQGTEDPTEQAPNRQNWLTKGLLVAEAKDIPPEGRWVQLDDFAGAPPPHTYKLTFPKNSMRSRVNFFYQGPRPPAFSRVRNLWQASTPNGVFYKDQATESVANDAAETEVRPERAKPVYTTEEGDLRKGPKSHWSVGEKSGGADRHSGQSSLAKGPNRGQSDLSEDGDRKQKLRERQTGGAKVENGTDDQFDFGAIDHVTHDDHHAADTGRVAVSGEDDSDGSHGSLERPTSGIAGEKPIRGSALDRHSKKASDGKKSSELSVPKKIARSKSESAGLEALGLRETDAQDETLESEELAGESALPDDDVASEDLGLDANAPSDEDFEDELNDELLDDENGEIATRAEREAGQVQEGKKKSSLLKRLFGRAGSEKPGTLDESEAQSGSNSRAALTDAEKASDAKRAKSSFLGRLFGRSPTDANREYSEVDLFREPDHVPKLNDVDETRELVQLNRKPATFFENCLAESIERIASHPEPASRLASPDRPQNYSVILIKTQSAEGYLVTPLGTEEVQEYTTFSEIIDYLKVHMQAQGEALTELSPPLLFESDPFAFLPWAQTSDHFVITARINGFDFTCAFLVAPISTMLIREESENMMAIPRSSVCAGLKLTFDLHLALPKNDKYLLYCRANDVLTDRAVEKFAKFGVQSLYIRKQDVKAYYAYCASVTLYLERLRKVG